MKKLVAFIPVSMLVAACASGEPDPLLISSVTVNTDLAAIQSREAVEYWQDLSSDLETAIAAEFAGNIDPTGRPVTVDIDELTLEETFTAGASLDTARLSGAVSLGDVAPDGVPDPTWTVTATAQDATPYVQEGGTIQVNPTTPAYYDAIVKAFADGAADTLRSGS